MFMVVMLHVLRMGGVLDNVVKNSLNYFVAWFLEIASICAVNTFALTTGYLMLNKKWKLSRLLSTWVQVVFYSLVFVAIFAIAKPGSVTTKLLLKSFFPVTFELLWYFTAYVVLCFLMPLLNKFVNALSKRQSIIIASLLVLVCSLFGTFAPVDFLKIGGGYTFVWLAILYVFGAMIKKFDFGAKIKKHWTILVYVLCVVIVVFSRNLIEIITTAILGFSYGESRLMLYTSPFVVLMSICLLLTFTKLKFPKIVSKSLAMFSPCAFAVYIIHMNPLINAQFMGGKFVSLATSNVFVLVSGAILGTLIIFVVCLVIEFMRAKIFKWTKINYLIEKFGNFIDEKIGFNKETK